MSKLKGKLAGVVFQQYEGLNVAKEYQPNVKNPSTSAQVASRARFKLASQKVAVYAGVLLVAASKVSQYVRNVRGALVNALYKAATWDDVGDTARLTSADFVNAVNGLNLNPPIPAPTLTGTTIGDANVQATAGDTICYTITALNSEGELVGSNTTSVTATDRPIQIEAPLTPETPAEYEVVAVAMRSQTENGVPIYSNIENMDSVAVTYGVNAGAILVSHISQKIYSQA